ncbi:hypothetical protein MASSI9I_21012 [Massilia sp. 9I]|nr:hypothetical protein MASSI9I_21012 [Massilia sp. 9I]
MLALPVSFFSQFKLRHYSATALDVDEPII